MKKVCAIHQPNFFPWLGYFNKIARSDTFVILDHVQQQKTGGSWGNRVKLLISGEDKWVTAPITRPKHDTVQINEIIWSQKQNWRKKLLRTINVNYAKAPCFSENIEFLTELINNSEINLAAYNFDTIKALSKHIGVKSDHFIKSSDLIVEAQSNELLINIIKSQKCTHYLCGGGADGYQDDALFEQAGIQLQYQAFTHPQYAQLHHETFKPGLSIIDALMNIGPQKTKELVEQ